VAASEALWQRDRGKKEMAMVEFDVARKAMVDGQIRPANVTRYTVLDAFLRVRRENFVPHAHRALAYADMQVPLGPNRVMLDPRTLGRMLDALELKQHELALVVGAGLGYTTALIAQIAAAVIALEDIPEFIAPMTEALSDADADRALVEPGTLSEGLAGSGPYDAILVEGGVETVPEALFEQLADGGRLVAIAMEDAVGFVTLWRRAGDAVSSRRLFNATAPVLPGFDAVRSFQL
jgi:protein-L-isoaspartate(D-aspartate) O-methyltransferase